MSTAPIIITETQDSVSIHPQILINKLNSQILRYLSLSKQWVYEERRNMFLKHEMIVHIEALFMYTMS